MPSIRESTVELSSKINTCVVVGRKQLWAHWEPPPLARLWILLHSAGHEVSWEDPGRAPPDHNSTRVIASISLGVVADVYDDDNPLTYITTTVFSLKLLIDWIYEVSGKYAQHTKLACETKGRGSWHTSKINLSSKGFLWSILRWTWSYCIKPSRG